MKMLAPALLSLALAACASNTAPEATGTDAGAGHNANASTANTALSLDAYHWRLSSANDSSGKAIAALKPDAKRPLQMDFSGGRVSVSGGCNRASGSYEHDAKRLSFGDMAQTLMACADTRLMELDRAIGERLRGSLPARIEGGAEAPRLLLTAGNGDQLSFEGVPTPATRYGGEGSTVFFEVAPQRAPCSHPLIPNMQCLQVRERRYEANGLPITTDATWQPLYQDIEGYRHEPGVRNVLRVKKYAIKNPPADASSVAYVLDMVIESEIVSK
jgi:heat shock protein HslJ